MSATEPQPTNGRVAFQQNTFVDLPQDEDLSLRDILKTAWRGRWIISFCVVASLALGYRKVQQTGDIWRAESRLYVEGGGTSALGIDGLLAAGARNFANTQAAVLKSVELLQAVVARPNVGTSSVFDGEISRVGFLREKLGVSVGRDDDVISISLDASDVDAACVVVNAVVEEYRRLVTARSETTVKDTLDALVEKRVALEEELDGRRETRDRFQDDNPVLALDPDQAGTYEVRQLQKFESQLIDAEIALSDAKASLEKATLFRAQPDLVLQLFGGVRITRDKRLRGEDPEIGRLRAELFRIESEYDENRRMRVARLQSVTEAHPSIATIDRDAAEIENRRDRAVDAIASMDEALGFEKDEESAAEVASILEGLARDVESANQRVKDEKARYDAQYERATESSKLRTQFRRLEFEFEQARARVDEVNESIRELDLADIGKEQRTEKSVTILDAARADTAELATSATLTLANFFFFGIIAGGVLTWLRLMFDRRIRNDEDLKRTIPDLILGVLPYARLRASTGSSLKAWGDHDSLAESARGLRTALTFAMPQAEDAILHIASPSNGEGKSTISSLLAIAIAKAGDSVIVVDADLRNPSQDELFDTPNEVGLSQALANEATLVEAIQKTELPTLDVMTTGGIPSTPAEMLISPRFDAILAGLSKRYDRVIVDSPPILAVSDSRIISTKCGGTLLVARADKTSRDALGHSRERLVSVGARIVGCALNAATARGGYGYGYGSGYGYGYGADHQRDTRLARVQTEPAAEPNLAPGGDPYVEVVPQAAPAPDPDSESRRGPQRVETKTEPDKGSGSGDSARNERRS